MSKVRTLDYWCTCRQCGDQFTMIIWVHPDPKCEDGYVGRVEKSRDLLIENGQPRHRCGGQLRVYGEQYRVRLVE